MLGFIQQRRVFEIWIIINVRVFIYFLGNFYFKKLMLKIIFVKVDGIKFIGKDWLVYVSMLEWEVLIMQ